MSLFGGGFSNPGRGISKEEAAKRNYFDIMGRHFWDFIMLNLLFLLVNIPWIGASLFLAIPYLVNIEEVVTVLASEQNVLLPVLPFIPFMFMGPSIAGLTYVLRNWSRQEHAFLVSDFFEHTKKNWKQGLALSIISTVLTYLYLTAVLFYLKSGMPYFVVLLVAAVLAVITLSVGFYTYPMVVTFDMKLKDIIKNALILSLAKLPQNVFYLFIIVGVHALLLWYAFPIWVILMCLFLVVWTGYTINYYVWHVMNKHMMSQIPAEEQKEAVFEDVK